MEIRVFSEHFIIFRSRLGENFGKEIWYNLINLDIKQQIQLSPQDKNKFIKYYLRMVISTATY